MTELTLDELWQSAPAQALLHKPVLMKPTIGPTGEWIEVPATWIDGLDHPVTRAALATANSVEKIQEALEKDQTK